MWWREGLVEAGQGSRALVEDGTGPYPGSVIVVDEGGHQGGWESSREHV
jgi:hypothetical protein